MLDRLDQLGSVGFDATTVALAAWFHDAVYDGADDDEELVAQLGAVPERPAIGEAHARAVSCWSARACS